MRLTDLLGRPVVDGRGRSLGRVHDVRLVQTISTRSGSGPGMEIDGLIVGARSVSANLGYAYGDVQGPWPVRRIMELLGRRAQVVPWHSVVEVSIDRIVIEDSASLFHPRNHGAKDD